MEAKIPENPRCTVYSQEYRDELRHKFLEAFSFDPMPFAKKLKAIGISKACFSSIKNLSYGQNKIVLKKMKCYVDGIKYEPPPEGYKSCSICEDIVKIEDFKFDSCRTCRIFYKRYSKSAQIRKEIHRQKLNIKRLSPGEYRDKYLHYKRSYYFLTNYGLDVQTVDEINREHEKFKDQFKEQMETVYRCSDLVKKIKNESKEHEFKLQESERKLRELNKRESKERKRKIEEYRKERRRKIEEFRADRKKRRIERLSKQNI